MFTDSSYLQHTQYRTSSNLSARASLHQRFSTNPRGWFDWAFDQLALQPNLKVLEVGGGPGGLWVENLHRLPHGLQVCLSDLSTGMVKEARQALGGHAQFTFANLNIQAIPLPTESFDLVVANHMLYHVPNLPQAVRELGRVLKPGGRLCAATNGRRHMQELHAWLCEFAPGYKSHETDVTTNFSLENAAERLAPVFTSVEVRGHENALWVTEVEPLVDYVLSWWQDLPSKPADLFRFFQAKIDAQGGLHITKEAGMVIGVRP